MADLFREQTLAVGKITAVFSFFQGTCNVLDTAYKLYSFSVLVVLGIINLNALA